MAKATLTKRIEFSASHRYHNSDWDLAKNQAVFGPCHNENGHGHNYLLEVTLRGKVDEVTGMIINLYDLKQVLTDVLEEFDHKHLNLDTPYFESMIPTAENFSLVLWKKFLQNPETRGLESLHLYEGEALFAEISVVSASLSETHLPQDPSFEAPIRAHVTRRYTFPLIHPSRSGHSKGDSYTFEITVEGGIDAPTGRIIDLRFLDRLVEDHILFPLKAKDFMSRWEPPNHSFSIERFTQTLWDSLASKIQKAQLNKVRLFDSNGTCVEYCG